MDGCLVFQLWEALSCNILQALVSQNTTEVIFFSVNSA